jgi:peptide/nickel transport system permease protein
MLARRLAVLPIVLLGSSVIVFIISQVLPADPARKLLGEGLTPEAYAQRRSELGLDKPLVEQYFAFLDRLFHGDLGESIRFHRPVRELILTAVPATLQLVIAALVLSTVLGVGLGVITGYWSGGKTDFIVRFFGLVGISMPSYFVGLVLIISLSFKLGWFPIGGRGSGWLDLEHVFLPALALSLRYAGSTMRLVRASLIESLRADYVRTAKSIGAPQRTVVVKYALRNSMIPAVTGIGAQLADIAGAVILIEVVFRWPGIGQLALTALNAGDFPLITGTIMFLTVYAVLINLTVDIIYSFLDPRMSTRRSISRTQTTRAVPLAVGGR